MKYLIIPLLILLGWLLWPEPVPVQVEEIAPELGGTVPTKSGEELLISM